VRATGVARLPLHPAMGHSWPMSSRLRNPQLWVMATLGFACGLPLALTALTLRQWLTESGASLAAIGFTANIGLAYTLKFLWAPALDQAPPPLLGRRRGWLLAIQSLLVVACLAFAWSDPVAAPLLLVVSAVAISFLSASQDIVVDAWRIETFPGDDLRGIALAAYIWGYRAALLVGGAGAIRLVNDLGWHGALTAMAGIAVIGIVATLAAIEPHAAGRPPASSFADRLRTSVIEPFRDFLSRPGAGPILAFVMLFKLGEALAHTMAVPFYNAMGFDRTAIAYAAGIPGLVASLLGAAAGGWLIARIGNRRALIITGFVQMASMALYFALAVSQGDWRILVLKITLENIAEGMADAAFITFLSSLCSTAFTATQYALLSSLSAIGLRTIGGFSGVLASALGWVGFYALTIFAAVPAMLVMLWLLRRFPFPQPPRSAAIP
jgi:PAT family beta-lactamase induction signal transducer AmpG